MKSKKHGNIWNILELCKVCKKLPNFTVVLWRNHIFGQLISMTSERLRSKPRKIGGGPLLWRIHASANENSWVCLKIVFPYPQWLMIIIPTKWIQLGVYPIFRHTQLVVLNFCPGHSMAFGPPVHIGSGLKIWTRALHSAYSMATRYPPHSYGRIPRFDV
jgi:hypothetical protein